MNSSGLSLLLYSCPDRTPTGKATLSSTSPPDAQRKETVIQAKKAALLLPPGFRRARPILVAGHLADADCALSICIARQTGVACRRSVAATCQGVAPAYSKSKLQLCCTKFSAWPQLIRSVCAVERCGKAWSELRRRLMLFAEQQKLADQARLIFDCIPKMIRSTRVPGKPTYSLEDSATHRHTQLRHDWRQRQHQRRRAGNT